MPIQAEAPFGKFVVVVVQLAAVPFTPKLLAPCVPLPGKETWTWASVAVVVALAQTMPPVVWLTARRSVRTRVLVSVPAEADWAKKGTKACDTKVNKNAKPAILVFVRCKLGNFI